MVVSLNSRLERNKEERSTVVFSLVEAGRDPERMAMAKARETERERSREWNIERVAGSESDAQGRGRRGVTER